MEKESFSVNENKEFHGKKIKYDLSIKKLAELLKNGKLTEDILEREVEGLNVEIYKLGYEVLLEAGLMEDFIDYYGKIEIEENETIAEERILGNYLKKRQQVEQDLEELAPEHEKSEDRAEKVVEATPSALQVTQPSSLEAIRIHGKREWWEVKRETEVMAIEDLDGDMRNFERHVRKLGVAEKDSGGNWNWTGGNKKLVFLGDILGDRSMDGMEITSIIGNLREQAEKQGGQVDFLCGNHDMEFITFLTKSASKEYAKVNAALFTDQSVGIWELAQFDPDPKSELKRIGPKSPDFERRQEELWPKLYDRIPQILENMRSDKKGKGILENICKLKVAVIHDDTLFCHTDPTMSMAVGFMKGNNASEQVDHLNEVFQQNLRDALLDGDGFDREYYEIRDVYLNTGNRKKFTRETPELFDKLAYKLSAETAGYLFKNGNIYVSHKLNHMLEKYGYTGHEWDIWKDILYDKESHVDVDEKIIKEAIDSWKDDNHLGGDYTEEIIKIFDAINKKDSNALYESENRLSEIMNEFNTHKSIIAKMRKSGVNAVMHGHTANARTYDENGFIVATPHGINGTGIIRKDGKIDLVDEKFREITPKQKSFPAQPPSAPPQSPPAPATPPAQAPVMPQMPPQMPPVSDAKQEKIIESSKKLSGLFNDFELSYDAIKEEAQKIQVSPRELALGFIQQNPELKSQFDDKLRVIPDAERTDKAIEKLALTVVLENEKKIIEKRVEDKNMEIGKAKNDKEKETLKSEKEDLNTKRAFIVADLHILDIIM